MALGAAGKAPHETAAAGDEDSAPPLPPDILASLNSRLGRRSVITGRITYPPASGLPQGHRNGWLVVAKAGLTRDLPYEVLAHAARHTSFPNDTTSDQWFDADQFTAYTALGRAVGAIARKEMALLHTAGPEPTEAPPAPRPRAPRDRISVWSIPEARPNGAGSALPTKAAARPPSSSSRGHGRSRGPARSSRSRRTT
jgi:hypothetical protein